MDPNDRELHLKDLVLVKDDPPIPFINIENFIQKVELRRREILDKDRSVYLYFSQVMPSTYTAIEKYRDQNRFHFRFTCFSANEILVVKIPIGEHEQLHLSFGMMLRDILMRMGVAGNEFLACGSQKYKSESLPRPHFFQKAIRFSGTERCAPTRGKTGRISL